jgi:hypothetical protein
MNSSVTNDSAEKILVKKYFKDLDMRNFHFKFEVVLTNDDGIQLFSE